LDLGCGTGSFALECKKIGCRVTAVDMSISKKLKDEIDTLVAPLNKVKLPPNSFDAIVLTEVIEHFTFKEAVGIIKNIKNSLKENGKIVITVPFEENLEENSMVCPYCLATFHPWLHKTSYDEEKVRELAGRASTNLIRCERIASLLNCSEKINALPFDLSGLLIHLNLVNPLFILCELGYES
jgi:cyclopropane fatty-acyl-phospholipid synthase-like methyltransferase